MKRIHILYSLFFLLLATGCQTEVADQFDEPSARRIESELQRFGKVLTGAPNGWVMEYYFGPNEQQYGGTPLFVKFDDKGFVRFSMSDNAPTQLHSATSHYSLLKDWGVTLNFDTYNEVLHQFKDPDNFGGKSPEGDYEFKLEAASADSVILTGKIHLSTIRMYPLQGTAEEYIRKAKAQFDSYTDMPAVSGVRGTFYGDSIFGTLLTPLSINLTLGGEKARLTFMFTDRGVKLYRPVTLKGKTLTAIAWDPAKETFSSPDGNVVLKLIRDPKGLKAEQMAGEYTFQYREGKTLPATIKQDARGNWILSLPDVDIRLEYDSSHGVFLIHPQDVKQTPDETCKLILWDTNQGRIYWGSSLSMCTSWNGDKDHFVLTLVDNNNDPNMYISGLYFGKFVGGKYKGKSKLVSPSTMPGPLVLTRKK